MKTFIILATVIATLCSCASKQQVVSAKTLEPPIKPVDYDAVLQAAQKLTITGWKRGLDYDFKTDSVLFDIQEADVTKVGTPDLQFVARPIYSQNYYRKVVVEKYGDTEYSVIASLCTKNPDKDSEPCIDIGYRLSWKEVEYVLQDQLLLILAEADKIR